MESGEKGHVYCIGGETYDHERGGSDTRCFKYSVAKDRWTEISRIYLDVISKTSGFDYRDYHSLHNSSAIQLSS